MSPSHPNVSPDVENLLGKLSSIHDVNQFASGVSESPQLMFDAFKLFCQSYETLKGKSSELDAANRRVQELEHQSSKLRKQDSTSQILSRLTDALRQQTQPKTLLMKDGEIFTGHKKDYYPWKETILLKLNSNADHFPNERSMLAYIYSQMNLTSKTHLQSWVKDGVLLFDSVSQMVKVLDTIFGDPNRVRDAVNRLHSNFQKNKTFSSWIVEIRRDAAIAGYSSTSQPLRDLVFYNMSLELKKALVHERDIDNLSFDEAIARLQDIDNRQRAVFSHISRGNDRKGEYFQTSSNISKPAPNDDPMDLSAINTQRRGALSQEEKDRRRRLGLCIYCSEKGHLLRTCPTRPQILGRSVGIDEDVIDLSGKD